MDGNITAIPSSTVRNVGDGNSDIPALGSCRELFDRVFPQYLALGMTYDEFYCKDHTLVIAYREAYKRKREEENQRLWLAGAYVYQALCRVSPLLIPFNSHPKAEPYLDKPFPLGYDDNENNKPDKTPESEAVIDKGLAYMKSQMEKFNGKFKL